MKAKTSEPRFERVSDERCEDCEYNGHLSNEGFPRKGVPRCSLCSNGRIRLITWEMIRLNPKLVERVNRPGARLALRSELLDPYAIKKIG